MPRLWLYNLHYFDDLNASGAENRADLHRRLIGRWIAENPPVDGAGWEPYPCSLRIVNWIKWALCGNELRSDWLASLALQSAWLEEHIEWHLLGNHLFANAKALVFAGLFFEGRDAEHWLQMGLEILEREIPEQVLSDGGQFELSPMYHAIATEDVLDLVNAAKAWPGRVPTSTVEAWRNVASKMLAWAAVMQHPDGRIALFNDSAFGIAPQLDELFDYAERLRIDFESLTGPLKHLEQSGYVRATIGEAVLFADVGSIGPDYLPGHAHADSLGFELSLFGDRWFVDTGCSTYDVSPDRLRQRGTAAHNTVIVNGDDSSEVWSSFRVARRARPLYAKAKVDGNAIHVEGAHDGYKRLPGRVIHARTFKLEPGRLKITDRLDGDFESADANFLLHPEVDARLTDNSAVLSRAGRTIELQFAGGAATVDASFWHPEFGMSIPSQRIAVSFTGSSLTTTFTWASDN